MNKYQEALIELVVAVSYTPEENNICGATPDVIEKYKNILQELVDKATPKRVDFKRNNPSPYNHYWCSNCDMLVEGGQQYCGVCGQKLDFSDVNE